MEMQQGWVSGGEVPGNQVKESAFLHAKDEHGHNFSQTLTLTRMRNVEGNTSVVKSCQSRQREGHGYLPYLRLLLRSTFSRVLADTTYRPNYTSFLRRSSPLKERGVIDALLTMYTLSRTIPEPIWILSSR